MNLLNILVGFVCGSLAALAMFSLTIIVVSNLPYISKHIRPKTPVNEVKREPSPAAMLTPERASRIALHEGDPQWVTTANPQGLDPYDALNPDPDSPGFKEMHAIILSGLTAKGLYDPDKGLKGVHWS